MLHQLLACILVFGLEILPCMAQESGKPAVQSGSAPTATAPPPAATPELVIDQIKKAVVFLNGTYQATVTRVINGVSTQVTVPQSIAGTGFFIYAKEPRLGENGLVYLVTNKHMIRQPSPAGVSGAGPYFKTLDARINTVQANPDGTQVANLPITVVDDSGSLVWFVDTADDTVDLAVMPIALDPKVYEYKAIQTELFATRELLAREHVNENDEVIFAGLFAWSPGAKKNYPIVRHGKLARLSEERIPLDRNDPLKTTEVHLADVMSFGGNSGSPVLLRVGGMREGAAISLSGYSYYLLGVMQGFFPEGMSVAVEAVHLKGEAAQNSGIAAVVPAQKIIDLLESPRGQAFQERTLAASYEKSGGFSEAEQAYQKAIHLLEASKPDHSDLAVSFQDYAQFLHRRKRDFEAVPLEGKAKRIRSNVQTDLMQPRM